MIQTPPTGAAPLLVVVVEFVSSVSVSVVVSVAESCWEESSEEGFVEDKEGDEEEDEEFEEDKEVAGLGWTQYWRMPLAAAWTVRQLLLMAGMGTARWGLA